MTTQSAQEKLRAALSAIPEAGEEAVDFYEREFYPLSNFSAFTLMWPISPRDGLARFDTSEAVYQWMKFNGNVPTEKQLVIQRDIRRAASAHEAFKIAEANRQFRRPNWDAEKVDAMRRIIRAKADQHEYVRRKLLETGSRQLIEGSWRDDFWGIGPKKDGQNMLGKLWMEIRAELRAALTSVIPEAIDGAFKFGDTVSKVGGDYTFDGTIQGVIVKRSGLTRYAVEDDRGILHIFNATQLRARTTDQKGDRHD